MSLFWGLFLFQRLGYDGHKAVFFAYYLVANIIGFEFVHFALFPPQSINRKLKDHNILPDIPDNYMFPYLEKYFIADFLSKSKESAKMPYIRLSIKEMRVSDIICSNCCQCL